MLPPFKNMERSVEPNALTPPEVLATAHLLAAKNARSIAAASLSRTPP